MIKTNESISLFEALEKSDYQENVKSRLASLFFDHFNNNQNKIYLLTKQIDHSEMTTNIFVLHHKVKIQVQGRPFDVPLLIYFPDSFPFGMPELYFEFKSSNIVINQKLPQGLVSPTDLRIHFEYFKKWPKETEGLLEILGYLFNIFTKAFPLYASKQQNEYKGNCLFDYSHSILVKLDQAAPSDTCSLISELNISKASTQTSKTSNNFFKPTTNINPLNATSTSTSAWSSNNNGGNNQTSVTPGENLLEIQTPQGNEEEMKKETMLSDEDIQSQLKEDLKNKLFQMVQLKRKRIRENEQRLIMVKRELEEKIKKINEVCSKEAEIMGLVNNLGSEFEQGVNVPVNNANNEDFLLMPIDKKCLSMITIKNPKTVARLVVEMTIEEMLPMYKKMFENQQISLIEAIKSIRNQSSRLFKMKESQRRNANI